MKNWLQTLGVGGLVLAALAVALPGCGDDDDDGGGGSSGSAGKAGSSAGGGAGAANGGNAGTPTGNGGRSGSGGAGGAAGGSGGAAGLGGGGGAGGNAAATACAAYCGLLETNCTGDNKQYDSAAACQSTCVPLVEKFGATPDFQCRATHAGMAQTDPGVHCPHAGPAGLGPCGGACDGYCGLMDAICPGKFANLDACVTACEADFPDADELMEYSAGAPAGDTIECRIQHATLAASTGAEQHCAHAAGESLCVAAP